MKLMPIHLDEFLEGVKDAFLERADLPRFYITDATETGSLYLVKGLDFNSLSVICDGRIIPLISSEWEILVEDGDVDIDDEY